MELLYFQILTDEFTVQPPPYIPGMPDTDNPYNAGYDQPEDHVMSRGSTMVGVSSV